MIRNKAVVNEDTSGTVQQLQSEIRRLKQLVEKLRSESLCHFGNIFCLLPYICTLHLSTSIRTPLK